MKRTGFIGIILAFAVLLCCAGCVSFDEKEVEEENLETVLSIADEYFDDSFEYDYVFYHNAGEFGVKQYIFVFTDGETINCIGLPALEDSDGINVYYDCAFYERDSEMVWFGEYEDNVFIEEW